MRNLIKRAECNKRLLDVLSHDNRELSKEWTFYTCMDAGRKLKSTALIPLMNCIGIIGTTYYLNGKCRSVEYDSIAGDMKRIFHTLFYKMNLSEFIDADILDVKEKKYGYDRTRTVKIIINNDEKTVLCYVVAVVKECDVYKKMANSSGKGLMITDIITNKPTASLYDLFAEAHIKDGIILNYVKSTLLEKIDNNMNEIKNMIINPEKVDENICDDIAERALNIDFLVHELSNQIKITKQK